MADAFDTCLAFTLRAEGGYVDDPADPGGVTNMGITLATFRQWSDDAELGSAQVQDMTERAARAIYRSLYWNPLRADALPIGVDLDAAAKCDPRALVADLADRQASYYRSLADFPIFGTGWLDRTEAQRNAALAMIA